MTRQKDLKRLTRARMKKTGESYTTARSQLVAKKRAPRQSAENEIAAKRPAASKLDYATLAGMSDAAILAKTGCDWTKWVEALDYKSAADWSHRDIAQYVAETWNLSGWWAQAVTVGYERIKGLREIGQRRSGSYEANKSKTYPVPVDDLFAAWSDARRRRKWLPESGIKVRKATENRALRMTWPDGSSVELWFTAKGASKSTVQVQHCKLESKADAESRKVYWSEKLDALASQLAER